MITKNEGYTSTYRFFKVIHKLKLSPQADVRFEMWRKIKSLLQTKD